MLQFHHIGIGTARFEDAVARYQSLGYELFVDLNDPGLNVRVAFLRRAGEPLIEVLAPLSEGGPLDALLKRRAIPGPYHTCYAVEDLAAGIEYLRERGFMPLTEPAPALAFGGRPVVFFYERDIGQVELVEKPPFGCDAFAGASHVT
ncbi:MAG: hypothetical protein EOO73_06085 [Myxococcales bacterium]|nr:MAG: hypothetical protein EOO73_06085 [Myxococcales bacterium]